jgi:hypothetical protein
MRSDPAADVNSDRGDLCSLNPNSLASPLWNPSRRQSEERQGIDQALFHAREIGVYIAPPFSQINDRVANQLAWAMISHVAAAVAIKKFDSRARQNVLTRENMLLFSVSPDRH